MTVKMIEVQRFDEPLDAKARSKQRRKQREQFAALLKARGISHPSSKKGGQKDAGGK